MAILVDQTAITGYNCYMFIFLRLILAHFIADFPLQFNKIYALKHKSLLGGIPHALIVSLSLIVCLWPYLANPGIWVFIYLLSFIHLFQDNTKIRLGSVKYSFWFYLLDQCFHVLTSATILVTKLADYPPPQANGRFLVELYNDNFVVILIIAFINATYNGLFLIKSFKLSFFQRDCSATYTFFEIVFGMLERALILTIFALGNIYFTLLPLLLFLRPLAVYADKTHILVTKCFFSRREILLSWAMACSTGIALRFVMWKFF